MYDLIRIDARSRARAKKQAAAAREREDAIMQCPTPEEYQATFQIPPRAHYEMNATMAQKRKLEAFGGTNFDLIDSLGREQAAYVIDFMETREIVRAAARERLLSLDAKREQSDERRVVWTFSSIGLVVIVGACWIVSRPSPEHPEPAGSTPIRAFVASPTPSLPTPTPPSFFAAVATSKRDAVAKYPALTVPGSAFNAKFVVRYQAWRSAHDSRLDRSDWPEILAADCAAHP